jgi:hypothetical protein
MTRFTSSIALLLAVLDGSRAFVPMGTSRPAFALSVSSQATRVQEAPYFVDIQDKSSQAPTSELVVQKAQPSKVVKGGAVHKKGVLSPAVLLSKMLVGEEKLNKVRAKAISLHSDVIASFVETSETVMGNIVLKQLFEITDKNRSGTIDENELKEALNALRFDWLQEKQIKGIFARADSDANGAIDMEEWLKEAPKTLRTNLIKLAKKNGGEMGLLV